MRNGLGKRIVLGWLGRWRVCNGCCETWYGTLSSGNTGYDTLSATLSLVYVSFFVLGVVVLPTHPIPSVILLTRPPITKAHTANPRIPFPPLATPSQTTPAAAQPMLNVPNSSTTFSLPRIASLNFSTNGIRVCCESFQKLAMCVRERNVAPAFRRAALMR